jgi:hypothetical protein
MKYGVLAIAMAVILTGSEAMAMGTGAGAQVPGSTQSPTGPNDRATGNWGGNNNNTKKKDDGKSDFQKAALPAALDVKQLDTAKFDKAKDDLKLTDDQSKKIDGAIKDIRDEGVKLAKEQDADRKAYDAAATQGTANDAAAKVVANADQIRAYDPNRKFVAELQRDLTADQWKIYINTKL